MKRIAVISFMFLFILTLCKTTVYAKDIEETMNQVEVREKRHKRYKKTLKLKEYEEIKTSFEITNDMYINALKVISNNIYDFSEITIACLGDSITAGINSGDGNLTYEEVIKEKLGVKEVLNFGIGGSSISTCWDEPMCERYKQIPQNTDIIIVLGGINDCFALDEEKFGNLKDLAPGTFTGDLNILMDGLNEKYSESEVFFITPLATCVINEMKEVEDGRYDYIVSQSKYVDAINILAKKYDFKVIDLYDLNVLNSNDDDVKERYVEDKIHMNDNGYKILGTIISAEIIKEIDK